MESFLIWIAFIVIWYGIQFAWHAGKRKLSSNPRPWENHIEESTSSDRDDPNLAYGAIFKTFYFISESDGKIDKREEGVLDRFILNIVQNSYPADAYEQEKENWYAFLMNLKKEASIQSHRQLGPELNIIYSQFNGEVEAVYKLFIDTITADLILDAKELNCIEIIDNSFKVDESEKLSEIRDAAIFTLSINQIEIYYNWYINILKTTMKSDPKKFLNRQYIKWKALEQSNDDLERSKSLRLQNTILKLRKEL
ncbi:MAG: hypothetical protein CMQ75_04855 [Gammaproteobacteria bacterium]|mgnify:CR=1 FL=1|nr:hypothetical protein [Gammaproteobacteria bacterium]|tara:strand:- start:1317 stop:2075 length:759 start_codon:yes stop_codon:yes gene_type:complete